jgi:hypothetical protein
MVSARVVEAGRAPAAESEVPAGLAEEPGAESDVASHSARYVQSRSQYELVCPLFLEQVLKCLRPQFQKMSAWQISLPVMFTFFSRSIHTPRDCSFIAHSERRYDSQTTRAMSDRPSLMAPDMR